MDKNQRQKKSLLVDYLKEYENYCFGKTDLKSYALKCSSIAEQLKTLCPEDQVYNLMPAAILIEKGNLEEAEKILKKYERNHVLQFRNQEFRACFLYLAVKLTEDKLQRKNIVIQLQKLYQKNPAQPSVYWYLVRLDETFEKNPEKKIAFLEKQWKLGCKQNLLYMEVILTLRSNPNCVGKMDDFLMQCYIWAQRRGVITKEMAAQISAHAMKLKQCERRYEYLLRECNRIFATKELLAALCSLYIRAGRIDPTAAKYYAKGVEYEININNLYEYYMMSTSEQNHQLLPEQVLLYFLYHDTLSSSQKAYLYKNIVKYGRGSSEVYSKYEDKIEKYTIESLLKRKINEEYAYLYDQVLHPEIFTKEMAEAMADLMFLRKITCEDSKIREVCVEYPQLSVPHKVVLKRREAYIPIYSPSAVVTLIDNGGNLYRNTIPYRMDKLLDVKKYIEICKQHVENHVGLILYFCAKRMEQICITEQTESYYRQIPALKIFTEEYRNAVMVRLMEYSTGEKERQEIPEEWYENDGKTMTKEQRGRMITYLTQNGQYEIAYRWLEDYGAVYVSANTILKVLTALSDSKKKEEELYYRLCYGCFQNGQVNYTVLKYLTGAFLGTCEQMAELWKQAKAFGVETYELEERILMQMMFTGCKLQNHFEVFLSYNQREPKDYLRKAYLTYFSRESFAKNQVLDNRFFFLLEEELLANKPYAEICHLAYLKYLSENETVSIRQRQTAEKYLKGFFAKKQCFGFMKKFENIIPEALILEDKVFVEYYAPASSEVVLHYNIENRDEESSYQTCRLYPAYGGIYSKPFTMFAGEKMKYFIVEKREDGSEKSTDYATIEMEADLGKADTRYSMINRMRVLAEKKDTSAFADCLSLYRFFEMATDRLFDMK